jgi:glycosyltransferase involved in cell wall biosynthesis
VESGIGYPHTFADFRVFESYAWMSYVRGMEQGIREHRPTHCSACNAAIRDSGVTADARRRRGIHFYDVVIPNFFDPNDFKFQEEKEDWILYIGRMVDCKGIQLAVEATKFAGVHLKLAGQGTLTLDTGAVLRGSHIEFVGFADVEKRKDLMARAKAVIVPTKYVAPFEGVNVEAQMSGTPVITSNQAAFAETVQHARTGYRCNTMEQYVWACQNVDHLSPKVCRDWAVANYSMDRVAKMYDEYLHMLAGIWHMPEGWGVPNVGRDEFDWQKKEYPS